MNLVGASDGFHPLDATGSEFLQLTVNSCRRAAWWARLGPCRPLTVSVGSLITGSILVLSIIDILTNAYNLVDAIEIFIRTIILSIIYQLEITKFL